MCLVSLLTKLYRYPFKTRRKLYSKVVAQVLEGIVSKWSLVLIGTVMSREEEPQGKGLGLETLMKACVSHQGIRKGRQRLHELA